MQFQEIIHTASYKLNELVTCIPLLYTKILETNFMDLKNIHYQNRIYVNLLNNSLSSKSCLAGKRMHCNNEGYTEMFCIIGNPFIWRSTSVG